MENKQEEQKQQVKHESIRDKIDKRLGVLMTVNDYGGKEVSVPCSKFPFEYWQEWETDCKKKFNGVRWMKMWHDHEKVRNFNLQIEVEMLKAALVEVEKEKQEALKEQVENENPLGLLGGGK